MPPDLVLCLWSGLGRQDMCRRSFSCLLGGATPASDRAAAAVAGPPLAVSVLLLLSMTRGKKTCKKAKDVRDTGKGEPDLMQLTC